MKFDEDLPFATIAIPAFNHENYIMDCLDSAAAQTYPNLDLVVIDDGSSDGTMQRIESFVERNWDRFRNIHVASRPNRGIAATFNELFDRSETEWVFITASDDIMYRDRVQVQMDAIRDWKEPDLAVVYGAVDWIGPDGTSVEPLVDESFESGVRHDMYLEFLLGNPPHGACQTFRRDAVLAVGGYDETLPVEDFYMSLDLSIRFPIGFIAEKLGAYRRHDSNLSAAYRSSRMVRGLLVATARFLECHGDKVPDELKQRVYRKNLLRAFRAARRERILAVPRLAWEFMTFKRSNKTPRHLYRYAELIGGRG